MSKRKKKRKNRNIRQASKDNIKKQNMFDPTKLDKIPVTYQEISDLYRKLGKWQPFILRKETFSRIEHVTERPLICYVAKTHNLSKNIAAYIEDSDLTGFTDLIHSIEADGVDVFIVSNGGVVEAVERIVRLLREHFNSVRFIVPGNAYSAATLMCFSGDEIIMDSQGTLGPIDPQINGIPAHAIKQAFLKVKDYLKNDPQSLTAYWPLISKYDLHTFEICDNAQNLSKGLARNWLSSYMLKCKEDDPVVTKIVEFFSNYDFHKSHGRSIDREKAHELGLKVTNIEEIEGCPALIRSLYNQYEIVFENTTFYKLYENAFGINWGRLIASKTVPIFSPTSIDEPAIQPGPPKRSE